MPKDKRFQDQLKKWETINLDFAGRPVKINDYSGLHMAFQYDAKGAVSQFITERDGENYGYEFSRNENGQIETVKSIAATAAYHHAWNAKSRSNLIFSMADIDNPTGAAGTENKSSSSIQINYLYSPVKQVSYGIMYLAAERETENGDDGKLSRVQVTAKYSF